MGTVGSKPGQSSQDISTLCTITSPSQKYNWHKIPVIIINRTEKILFSSSVLAQFQLKTQQKRGKLMEEKLMCNKLKLFTIQIILSYIHLDTTQIIGKLFVDNFNYYIKFLKIRISLHHSPFLSSTLVSWGKIHKGFSFKITYSNL